MDIETARSVLGVARHVARRICDNALNDTLSAIAAIPDAPETMEVKDRLSQVVADAHRHLVSEPRLRESHPSATITTFARDRGARVAIVSGSDWRTPFYSLSVLGLARLNWSSHHALTGAKTDHSSEALVVQVVNTSTFIISGLYLHDAVLIDDLGNQYSALGRFSWMDDRGRFIEHGDDLAPNAMQDGFLVFPQLRMGATRFVRFHHAKDIYLDGQRLGFPSQASIGLAYEAYAQGTMHTPTPTLYRRRLDVEETLDWHPQIEDLVSEVETALLYVSESEDWSGELDHAATIHSVTGAHNWRRDDEPSPARLRAVLAREIETLALDWNNLPSEADRALTAFEQRPAVRTLAHLIGVLRVVREL